MRGSYFHIGPLDEAWVAELRSHLASQGLDPQRFVYRGLVPSLWAELQQLDAACYLGSAPVGGGRAAVEAQGCGYPLVFFNGQEQGSLLANYGLYADQELGWGDVLDLANNPAGWGAVDHPEWGKFTLGKTNPNISTSGLAATVGAFYAATGRSSDLSSKDLKDKKILKFVGDVEKSVVHYGDTTLTFLSNLQRASEEGQGMTHVSAAAVERGSEHPLAHAIVAEALDVFGAASGLGAAGQWGRIGTGVAINETSTGWQTVRLAQPVPISANTTYIVSYHAPKGRYSITRPFFTSAYTRSPLVGPASSTSAPNGVYAYSTGPVMPTKTYASTNYFVDVVFE